jgi:hypothetical protein
MLERLSITEKRLDEILEYLDELRDNGETNMNVASALVASKFTLSKRMARKVVSYWMKTYSVRHPREIEFRWGR